MKPESRDSLRMIDILKLNDQERRLAIAVWTAEKITEYEPLPFPDVPRQMEEFLRLNRSKRAKVDSQFWKESEIETYMILKNKAYVYNMSCYQHLKWCLSVLNEAGHIDRIVIEKMLDKFFETKMYHNNRIKELLNEPEEGQFVKTHAPTLAKDIRWDE